MKLKLSFYSCIFLFFSCISFLNADVVNWEKQETEFCQYLLSGLYGEVIQLDKKISYNTEKRNVDIIFINKWDNGKPTLHKLRLETNNYNNDSKQFFSDKMFCWTGFIE